MDLEKLPPAVQDEPPSAITTGATSSEVELVDWDGEHDLANPGNWPTLWKWGNIGVISIITIITYVLIKPAILCCTF